MISKSPKKGFSIGLHKKRDDNLFRDVFSEINEKTNDIELDPDWQKNNMEYDLRSTVWILEKTRNSHVYAQNLYAALCDNDFIKNDVWNQLLGDTWCCSWRYAGGIIADMREMGDYVDWYCSGISQYDPNYIPEGMITKEIRNDLLKLGWAVIDSN